MKEFIFQLRIFQRLKQYPSPRSLLVERTSQYSFSLNRNLWRRYRTRSCYFSEKSLPFSCDIILVRIILVYNKEIARTFNTAPLKVFMCLEVYSSFKMFVQPSVEFTQPSVIFFEHLICHIQYNWYL
jgi:hypothetical protein